MKFNQQLSGKVIELENEIKGETIYELKKALDS